ncbi:GAF domain-containing protein [Coleofasciculus sp. H7-2]|uniref:GAF domain-containing sensor histidine kinase n=1 Tax=Coleofasciculus sp. H7-2 TaxID=3351545 RepID=UPI00366D59C2
MNDAQADMDAASAIAKRMSHKLVEKRRINVSTAQEELAAREELPTSATLTIEPLTSPMPSPVEPGFIEEYKGALMHYPSDRCTQLRQQITQILLTSSDPETVLPKIADVVGKSLQVDACFIKAIASHQATPQAAFWYAEALSWSNGTSNAADAGTVELKSLRPLSSKVWMQDNAVLEEILSDRQPVAISDTQAIEIGRALEDPVRAVMGIQAQFQSSANGVIVVGRSQPGDWTDVEQELLKAVSDSVAIAISQVQLQRQVRIAAQYQILINQLTLAIRAGRDVNQILQLALAGTAQAFQVHRGFILLLKYVDPPLKNRSLKRIPKAKVTVVCESPSQSNSEQAATIEDTESVVSPSWLNHSFALSECHWCQQVFMQSPEPLAIASQADLATSNPADTSASQPSDLFNPEAMPALLMVPLESQGIVLGFLVLQHHQPRSWQSEELELVKLVSAQASTAIIQTQSLRQVQALVEERTAQLQGSMEMQAKLYEKTRQQLDQLRQLNQVKDEFISNLSHELKTPLTKMKMAICMLRQAELPLERRAKYLEILDEQCTQEINLIADLLALQELESKKSSIHLQKVDLKQVIQELVEAFEQKWGDKGLTLAVELPKRSLMLQTDADSLNRILQELLTNAGKYSEPDSTVHLRATHEINPQGNQIVLQLSNNGSGISPTEMGYIFDKFRRGEGITKQAIQGTGLGLALVKSLVQHINGAIAVSSCSTEDTHACETCFTLTLPQSFDSIQV